MMFALTEMGSTSVEPSELVSLLLDPTPVAASHRLPPSEALERSKNQVKPWLSQRPQAGREHSDGITDMCGIGEGS